MIFIFYCLQELRREVGKLGFLYESEVLTWTNIDFTFSYAVRLTLLSHVIYALLVYISNTREGKSTS